MKISTFTFKKEALWTIAFSLAPLALALLVILIVRILR